MSDAPARESRTALCPVTFAPSGETVAVPVGTSLLDAAILCELDIAAPCGGQGRCGRCRVRVSAGDVERRSNSGLVPTEILDGWAVACQTFVRSPVEVEVPERRSATVRPHGHAVAEPESLPLTCDWRQNPAVRTFVLDIEPPSLADNTSDFDRLRRALSQQHGIDEVRAELPMLRRLGKDLRTANWKVSVTLEMRDWVYGTYLPPRLIRVYPSAFGQRSMGVAVDLGTTSVVVYLVDFSTAQVVDTAGAYNKQISCGDDVISRIIYAKRDGGLGRLQRLAVETINELLAELQERNRVELYEIHEVAVAGNTTMTHLLLGLDPRYLRQEPYIPTVSVPPKLVAGELGLRVNALARVHGMPAIGSYVGGDITAGVVSSGLYATDKLTVFIDIGTNGEMVLGNRDWLVACACSAGPAFEGGGVGCGMRATAGAVEDVWVDSRTLEPTFRTVDGAAPRGICGSGLIDLVAELFMTGVIDKGGRFNRGLATPRVREGVSGHEYVVVWGDESADGCDIAVSENDINNLLRAKAAVYAGVSTLCRSVGVDLADVEQFLIGGAFGQYIDVQKAVRIGLLPVDPARIVSDGNTALRGARLLLLCPSRKAALMERARTRIRHIALAASPDFQDVFTDCLGFPEA